jgi:hypothetical protein
MEAEVLLVCLFGLLASVGGLTGTRDVR